MHQRTALANEIGKFEVALPRHRADLERPVVFPDEGEPLDLVEVDDVVRQHEPHIQHRHQRLPAGQELGILEPAKEGDGIADCAGVVVAERRWLHAVPACARVGARLAISD